MATLLRQHYSFTRSNYNDLLNRFKTTLKLASGYQIPVLGTIVKDQKPSVTYKPGRMFDDDITTKYCAADGSSDPCMCEN